MITQDQLTTAGYRKYPPTGRQYATAMYQKRFDDAEGKKYFIQFYEYAAIGYLDPNVRHHYGGDAQFKDRYGNTFNVECLTNESIEQVEDFFESVWSLLKLEHCEKWES